MATVSAEFEIGKIKVPVPSDFFTIYFRKLFFRLGIIDTTSPYFLEGKKKRKASLLEMGEILAIVNDNNRQKLSYHGQRINRYHKIQYCLLGIVFGVFFGIAVIVLFDLGFKGVANIVNTLGRLSIDPYLFNILKYLTWALLGSILWFLYFIVPWSAGAKIVALATDRNFSESILLWTVIILMIQLQVNDQVLDDSEGRKALLYRLNDLAMGSLLYSRQYSIKDPENREWIRTHFNRISKFIYERERWVIAPRETTLEDLRRDFKWLADVFINGRFGSFEWRESHMPNTLLDDKDERGEGVEKNNSSLGEEKPEKGVQWAQQLKKAAIFIFGIAFPIGLLLYLNSVGGKLGGVMIDLDALGSITLAWVLVGIERLFNLDVLSPVVDAAKGLKI